MAVSKDKDYDFNKNKRQVLLAQKALTKTESNYPRQCYVKISYDGTRKKLSKVTENGVTKNRTVIKGKSNPKLGELITDSMTAFTFTDIASGASDNISITMHDIDREWLDKKFPKRGADFGAKIVTLNWERKDNKRGPAKAETYANESSGGIKKSTNKYDQRLRNVFNCGRFVMDDITFSGAPTTCVISGVSIPINGNFKSKPKNRTWESTTFKEVCNQIMSEVGGMKLVYEARDVPLRGLEQNNQSDSEFIKSICDKYDFSYKIFSRKLVIFRTRAYEKKKAVMTLKEKDMLSWNYNTTIDGTYTGVLFSYSNPDSNDTIKVALGSATKQYVLNTQASDKDDAQLQAIAKVNAANRDIEKLSVTIFARENLIATNCIKIKGLGKIDGKYYIDEITHDIGNGYTQTLKMHKVQPVLKFEENQ